MVSKKGKPTNKCVSSTTWVPAAHTTWKIGGPARWFARPTDVEQLRELLDWRGESGVEMAVIGLGSNLLAADGGFDGLVVRLAGELAAIERDGDRIHCGGGASLAAVVKRILLYS